MPDDLAGARATARARLVCAVAVPRLCLELAGVRGRAAGVVLARAGAERTERTLTGNARLDEATPEARAFGVRAGQTLAQARSRCAALEVRVVREEEVRGALERLAEALLAFGAPVSFDARTLYVDVTTSGRVFSEEAVSAAMTRAGHDGRVAVASGPALARAFAHCAPSGQDQAARDVSALPLEAFAEELGDALPWLSRLGLRTMGDLRRAPRRGLGTRLGARAARVLSLLDGRDDAPLAAWVPPEIPSERVDLEWGTDAREAVVFVARTLAERLAQRLEGRGVEASRLELVLDLDRTLVPAGGSRALAVSCALPAPMHRASELVSVLRARLETVELPAPVLSATLRALERSPQRGRALHLFAPESKAEAHLARVAAELGALLGEDRVGTLEVADTFDPARRTRLVPIVAPRSKTAPELPSCPEPLRWLRVPVPHAPTSEPPIFLHRTAYVEWWRSLARPASFVARWDARGEVACVRDGEVVGWMG